MQELANSPFSLGGSPIVPDADIMVTGHVPTSSYTSQEYFDQEVALFKRSWLNLLRLEDLPEPGSWVVKDLDFASVSVLIVRGKDDVVRAFHNVCSHRSMKLVWGSSGQGGRFACPYHAWLYSSEGKLLHIPDEATFSYVDKESCNLKTIACEVWEGFVFISLNPRQSLREFLGPLADWLKDVPFNSYLNTARITASLNSNWKLAMESQGEAYHVRMLHSKTVSDMLSSKDNPFVHPIDWKAFGAHRFGSIPRNPDYALNPKKVVQTFAFMNTTPMVVEGADSGSFAGHVNPFKSNTWGNDQYLVFPNLIFHVALSGWWIHRYYPVAPNKCKWEYVGYYKQPASLREEFALEYAVALNRDTLMEDNFAVEKQQQVMAPEINPTMYYGDGEILCRHMSAVMHAALDAANVDAAMQVAAE